jgi:hypothetical protein
MMKMRKRSAKQLGNGITELLETPDDNYMLKLSSWITRHLMVFHATPSETNSSVSAHTISDLMTKLDCPLLQNFPTDRSNELKQLQTLFMTSRSGDITNPPCQSKPRRFIGPLSVVALSPALIGDLLR